jgi:hypothetical protein
MTLRRPLRRIHLWLGWLVGVPLLFWTASGLFMVARPIDEVRGTALRAPAPKLAASGNARLPDLAARPAKALAIEVQGAGPVWIATFADGSAARASVATGAWLPPVSESEARAIARAAYAPAAPIAAATRTQASAPPLDLRRARPAWGVTFADGTHLYVDADTGSVLALRTGQWRWYDWMWGLHIMDLESRENSSHALLIGFAALAFIATLLGLALLPLASRRRR